MWSVHVVTGPGAREALAGTGGRARSNDPGVRRTQANPAIDMIMADVRQIAARYKPIRDPDYARVLW